MRCHLAGWHIDDQDRLRPVGQLEYVQVRQVGLDVVADPLGVLLPVDLVGGDARQDGRLVLDPEDDQPAAGVGHGGDVLGELVPPAIPGRLGKHLLPVQVVGLLQVVGRGLADHVEGERTGRASEVFVQSCPCACHARQRRGRIGLCQRRFPSALMGGD